MTVLIDSKSAHAIMRCTTMLQRKISRHKELVIRELAKQGDKWAQEQVAAWDHEDGKKEFPLYRPDGEDIQSVAEVAAMLGVKDLVAAHYVLEQKELSPEVYRQAKALSTPPASDKTGVAIMLHPSTNDVAQIAIPDGTAPEELHCTIGYFGDVDEVNFDHDDFMTFARSLAGQCDPFTANLNGLTRFSGDGDTDPLVVNVDSPMVEEMRTLLKDMCKTEQMNLQSEHGFTPHMTIGYINQEDPMPFDRWVARPCQFDSIMAGFGDSNVLIPLGMVPGSKDLFTGTDSGGIGKPGTYATAPGIPPRHAPAFFVRRAKRVRRRIGNLTRVLN